MATPLRVLVVEDAPDDAELMILRLTEEGFQSDWRRVDNEQDYLAALESEPDLILADWSLPRFSGLRALQRMRERVLDIPLVIVSGSISEEAAVESMRQGAYDYVLKDRPARLGQVVRRALEDKRLREERKRAEEQIRIVAEIQSGLLRANDLLEIYELTAVQVSQLIGDGIALTTILDEATQTLRVAAYAGLDVPLEKVIRTLRVDPTQMVYSLKDITEDELKSFRGGKLERLEGGIHALSTGRIPKAICVAAERLLRVDGIYTMGFVWHEVHYGGLVILARGDLSPNAEFIEQIVNLAVIAINRLRADEALRQSEAALKKAQQVAHVGSWTWRVQDNRLEWSDEMYRIFGIEKESFTGKLTDVIARAIHPDDRAAVERSNLSVINEGKPIPLEYRVVWPDGTVRVVWAEAGELTLDGAGKPAVLTGIVQDITDRKQAEERDSLGANVLDRLNQPMSATDTLRDILRLIGNGTGIEAVGIRLREGDDFPYYETNGFPDHFVQMERYLCARDEGGTIVRDTEGNAVLECMCGNILCGRTNPKFQFFTDGGSFWTNSTSDLLASTMEADRQARTRNRCNGEGYESVALVPLRAGDEIIGLLQLNDHRRNQFTRGMIAFLEGLSASIGIALARKRAEEQLRLNEARLEGLWKISQYRAGALQDLLAFALEEALRLTNSKIGYIYHYSDERKEFTLNKWSKDVMKECTIVDKQTIYQLEKTGIWGEAVRQRQPIIVNDFQAPHPLKKGYPEGHAQLHKYLTVPVFSGDRIVAVIGVANKTADYDESDVRQLTLLMDSVWQIVERQRAEEALRESEGRFRNLFEESPVALREEDLSALKARIEESRQSGVTDFRAYFESHPEAVADCMALVTTLDVNKATLGLFRATDKEQMIGNLSGIFPEGMHDSFVAELVAIADGQASFEGEVVNQTLSGKKIHAVLRWCAVPGYEESLARVLVSIVDITKRQRAEEALRESEERFRGLYENAVIGIYRTTPEGEIQMANPALMRMMGYESFEELAHRNLEEKGFEPDYPRAAFKERMEKEGQVIGMESAWKRRNGSTIYVLESARAIRDAQGKSLYYEGTVEDITERKRAEEALRESEFRFRATFEQAAVGVSHQSVDGRYLRANQKLCDILGYTEAELLAMHFRETTYAEDLSVSIMHRDQLIAGEVPTFSVEKRYICKDGSLTWANVTVSLVRTPTGEPDYFISIVEDISERKRLEDQLRQAQRMETVGRLAGGVAHDFNNLLTAISGYSAFALESLPPSDPVRADIEQVVKAADRAAGLTRQLLAFSRRQIIEMRVISLNDLVLDMDKMLRRLIGEDIELATIPGDDLASARADPGQLEQVLVNLVVNARDAMPGGGTLTIETANVSLDEGYARLHPGLESGDYVMLAVTDTGTGMTDEVKSHLFEPFFTTKGVGKGTGLGLSTVYGIVKQHGGYTYVYSELGKGSTFKVYLPAVEAEAEGLSRRDAEGYLPKGSETVLVVEDEATVRGFIVRTLAELGYKPLEAINGEEALRVAREHHGPIHLLLTDVVMPQMGGKELGAQMRVERPDIRVLFASGYTDSTIVHDGILDKGLAFLQKPFTTATLARKVREVLGTISQD